MKTNYDDSNWREESLPYYTGKQEELLREGPKSLAQAWMMHALKQQWKKRNGYKDPKPLDCQSSLRQWEESVQKCHKEL